MDNALLQTHSWLRYFILIALVVLIVKSLLGLQGKKPFTKLDDKISLYTFIFTHLQLLVGLILYFIGKRVQFGPYTMSDPATRYFTVEHAFTMLIVVALITVGRISMKKLPTPEAKFKRLLIFNSVALVLIVVVVYVMGAAYATI